MPIRTVAARADYVTAAAGGAGAVREICHLILIARGALGVRPGGSGRIAAMMRRYAAVAIAALVLTLVYMYSGEDTPAPLPPELADEPDVYIEDAAITKFAADGGVRYRLWADRIKQFEERSVTYFDNPVIRLSQQVGPPWQARAARGEIRQRPR